MYESEVPSSVKDWLARKAGSNNFAASLADQLGRRGYLSDNQVAAVKRSIEKDRQYELDVRRQQDAAPAIGVQPIVDCLQKGLDSGLKAPKIRLGAFAFKPAKPDSRNPGAIYVTEGGVYLGKIAGGKLQLMGAYRDREEAILRVAADPVNEAIAYGKKYGLCALCSRDLSDPVSVERGIGPICADRFGF